MEEFNAKAGEALSLLRQAMDMGWYITRLKQQEDGQYVCFIAHDSGEDREVTVFPDPKPTLIEAIIDMSTHVLEHPYEENGA